MSTQINITVDSGGLTDRAKQQQQAARQAQLEKERTLNLSAEALDKRVAAQAAKGLSVDGQPLNSSGFKQPQIERRPAATRTDSRIILTPLKRVFGSKNVSYLQFEGGQEDILDPESRKCREKFGYFYADLGAVASSDEANAAFFSATAGPLPNTSAVVVPPDGIVRFQTQGKNKNIKTGANSPFTLEAWVYTDTTLSPNRPFLYNEITIGLAAPSIEPTFLNQLKSICQLRIGFAPSSVFTFTNAYTYAYSSSSGINALLILSSTQSNESDGRYPHPTVVPVQNAWNHLAIMMAGNYLYWFVNGSLCASVYSTQGVEGDDLSLAFNSYTEVVADIYAIAGLGNLYLRGLKFTPKAVYSTSGFTPNYY